MSTNTFCAQMQEYDAEIQATNKEIRRIWKELLSFKRSDPVIEAKKNQLAALQQARPVATDPLITNFVIREFIHRIYGYPDFGSVLKNSLLVCKIKRQKRIVQDIGLVVSIDEQDEVYGFSFNECTISTNVKLTIKTSDGLLHLTPLSDISNDLPRPEELLKFKRLCEISNIVLPKETDARIKVVEISNAATRVLTDAESLQIDLIRTKSYTTVRGLGKKKLLARRFQEIAGKRGQIDVKKRHERTLNELKAKLQETLDKAALERLVDKRIENYSNGVPLPPKMMDGFTRVPTFAPQSKKDEMATLAQKNLERLDEAKRKQKQKAVGPDLFDLHDFTIITETNDPQLKSTKSGSNEVGQKECDLPKPTCLETQLLTLTTAKSSIQKRTKISYKEYKQRNLEKKRRK